MAWARALRTRRSVDEIGSFEPTVAQPSTREPQKAGASHKLSTYERLEAATATPLNGVSLPNVDCDEPRLTGGTSFRTMGLPLVRARGRIRPKAAASLAASDVV